ncbi:MAG: hypothetical protein V3R65_00610 [Acidiferrobacterales bacterium]
MSGKAIKISATVITLTAFFFTTGFLISKLKVDPNAFGKNKRFAIVSITSLNKITSNQGQAGVFGAIKAISKKYSFSSDARPVVRKMVPILFQEMAKSRHFRLITSRSILNSRIYKNTKGAKLKGFMGTKMITAPGYKYIKSKSGFKKLAKELNVDAVMLVHVNYGVATSWIGPVGKNYGTATVTVLAVDQNGKSVWSHTVVEKNKKGRRVFGIGPADFKAIEPAFYEATRAAIRKHLKKLDKKL